MTNPTKTAVDAMLESLREAVKRLDSMEASIKVLKLALIAQVAGADGARFATLAASMEAAEAALTAQSHADIDSAFEVLKHLIWKGSTPDA